MDNVFALTGPWFWFIVAGVLLIGELLVPGIFLLWLGMAAALTGIVHWAFGWGWQTEAIIFAAFSISLVAASWRYVMNQRSKPTDQPNLNYRHANYVGRAVKLEHAIDHGRGKVRIDDTLWDVEGPDLPKGTSVKITEAKNMILVVERAS
jgi:membrane protein implicated in regulation of membrane protease activity